MTDRTPPRSQPILNLPPAATILIVAILAIHAVRTTLLSEQGDLEVLFAFAFIPARVTAAAAYALAPGGEAAAWWSFVTYSLLHADWGHVLVNGVWLAAFGSPLARRFGTSRFLVFSAVGAIAGAALHLVTNWGAPVPMVGASAMVSAHMAGAARFVFTSGIPFGFGNVPVEVYQRPAPPLALVLRDRRVFLFLAIWFGINLVFGIAGSNGGITSGTIAWQAHIGGFLAGLVLFPLFDPASRRGARPVPPFDSDRA